MKIAANSESSSHGLEVSASKPFADELPNQRHARLAAHEDDLVQVTGLKFCIGQSAETMFLRAHHEVARQIFELQSCEDRFEAEGGREKRQCNFRLGCRGKLNFGLFCRFAETSD